MRSDETPARKRNLPIDDSRPTPLGGSNQRIARVVEGPVPDEVGACAPFRLFDSLENFKVDELAIDPTQTTRDGDPFENPPGRVEGCLDLKAHHISIGRKNLVGRQRVRLVDDLENLKVLVPVAERRDI